MSKRTLKKSLAAALAALMAFLALPPVPVSANPNLFWMRRPIEHLLVQPVRGGGDNFTFNVVWPIPNQGAQDTGTLGTWHASGNVPPNNNTVTPTHYDVGVRNATANEQWSADPDQRVREALIPAARRWTDLAGVPAGVGNHSLATPAAEITPGHLHEIWVDPFWFNPIWRGPFPDPAGGPPFWTLDNFNPAPMMTGQPHATTIFLSEVVVTNVTASPNEITVRWLNPLWSSGRPGAAHPQDFFDEWIVAWNAQPAGAPQPIPLTGVGDSTSGNSGQRRISTADLVPILEGGRQYLQLTIPGLNLSAGVNLGLRVEPLRGGRYVRQGTQGQAEGPLSWTPTDTFDIGGTSYRFIGSGNRNGNVADEFRWRNNLGAPNPTIVQPQLRATPFGPDRILLDWDSLAGISQNAREVRIYELLNDQTMERIQPPLIVFTSATQIANVNTHPVEWGARRWTRHFIMEIHMGDAANPIVIESNVATIPWQGVEFEPWRPEIRAALAIPEWMIGNAVITNIRFLAFSRYATNQEERDWLIAQNRPGEISADSPLYVDGSVQYRLIISDSRSHLAALNLAGHTSATVLGDTLRNGSLSWNYEVPGIPSSLEPNFMWNVNMTQFFPAGSTTPEPLVGNRTYYMMIVANWNGVDSEPAFFSVFMPPFGIPEVNPLMLSSPPLRLLDIDGPNVTVGWDVRFLEIAQHDWEWPGYILPPHPQTRWHAAAFVDSQGDRWFGSEALRRGAVDGSDSVLNEILRRTNDRTQLMQLPPPPPDPAPPMSEQLRNFLDRVRPNIAQHVNPPGASDPLANVEIRVTDLMGFGYQAHLVTLEEILNFPPDPSIPPSQASLQDQLLLDGPYGRFMRFMRHINDSGAWAAVDYTVPGFVDDGSREFEFSFLPAAGQVQPNTSYVLFVRTVHPTNPGIFSLLPTYLLFTTPDDSPRPDIRPTVPVIREWRPFVTQTEIGVYWNILGGAQRVNGVLEPIDMTYTIRWSESIFDYPDSFMGEIAWAQILDAIRDPNNPSGVFDPLDPNAQYPEASGRQLFIRLVIPSLFPQTMHHVWVQATNRSAPPISSAWSNPVDIRTLPVMPPPPPGLNRVPQAIFSLMGIIPVPTDLHMILTRVPADSGPRPDASEGDGALIPLPPTHNSMHLVHFADQPPNTLFYARARTVRTHLRGPGNAVLVEYNYEIEVATNELFLDPLVIVIPPLSAPAEGTYIRMRSSWVSLRISTGLDPGAFPGPQDPAQYPMPDLDFEITYDPATQTLMFRFRSNRIGADGLPDQNADFRMISRLLTERVTVYTIDLVSYAGLPVSNRIVEAPVSIVSALEEQRVALVIETGQYSLRVPPGAFNTAQVRALNQAQRDYFQIALSYNPRNMPSLDVNTSFAAIPAALSVTAAAAGRHTDVRAFNRPIEVSLKTGGAQNVGLFKTGEGIAGWQDAQGELSWADMSLTAAAHAPMTFAGIARNAPPVAPPGQAPQSPPENQAMQRVLGRLTFTDLVQFDPSRSVTAGEFNNVVSAVANGRGSVTLAAQMTAADRQALERARLYTPAAGFNRAAATDTLVRLYELRTRQVLAPVTPIGSVPGLSGAPAEMHGNMRKAADIGFIAGPFFPNNPLTMGEMMLMLDVIFTDSGR